MTKSTLVTAESIVTKVTEHFARIAQDTTWRTAWISLRSEEDVIAEALQQLARQNAGENLPLFGMLFGVKDNIDVAGIPTTAAFPADAPTPDVSATVVQKLRDAGAVPLGKTNLDQFATGLVGTRSPYGAVPSATDPDRVSGGSSAGSAVAVARHHVDFALGTDTAGSGRVPAAFNGIVGIKPTLGLVSNRGVLAACEPYDAVTVFANSLDAASQVMDVMIGKDDDWHSARSWSPTAPLQAPEHCVLGIPDQQALSLLDADFRTRFDAAVDAAAGLGFTLVTVDFTPLLEAARLLYDGGLVVERFAAYGERLASHPDQADQSVRTIVEGSKTIPGWTTVRDQHRLREIRHNLDESLAGVDALLTPTTVRHPTLAEVQAEPLSVNSELGVFTNFMNLLDLCGVAVPLTDANAANGFGVTVVAREMADQVALDVASRLSGSPSRRYSIPTTDVVFFGAHMQGEALNEQITALGARLSGAIDTAPEYEMAWIDGTPARASVRPAAADGRACSGELWSFPVGRVAEFLHLLPVGAAIGPVRLADGRNVLGFLGTTQAGTPIPAGQSWRDFRRLQSTH